MYFIPGYVRIKDEGDIFIESELLKNQIKITDGNFKFEMKTIMQNDGCDNLDSPLKKALHEQEMLMTREEIYDRLYELKGKLSDVLVLTLMPTEACNFKCSYCYESHEPVLMSQHTLDVVYQYVEQNIDRYKKIDVSWFGGEPTLCKEKVCTLSKKISSLCKRNNKIFASSMTTNGYLLDVESFKGYLSSGINSYQITIDGWSHNATRPLKSGGETLKRIISNLKSISKLPNSLNFNIMIRHNILYDDKDFTWYDCLKDEFGKDKRFSMLIRAVGNWGGEDVKKLHLLSESESEANLKEHVDYLNRIGFQTVNGKRDIFSKICYANYPNSMVVRADGRIEKCTVCLNKKQNLIGKINECDGSLTIDTKKNDLWTKGELQDKCLSCKYVLSCLNMHCRKNHLINGKNEDECSRNMSRAY